MTHPYSTEENLEFFARKLDCLGDVSLPASLSAQSLFARLDEGTLTLETPAPQAKVLSWGTFARRALPVAACLVLVLAAARYAPLLEKFSAPSPAAAPRMAAAVAPSAPSAQAAAPQPYAAPEAAPEDGTNGAAPSPELLQREAPMMTASPNGTMALDGTMRTVMQVFAPSPQAAAQVDAVSKAYAAADLVLVASIDCQPSRYGEGDLPTGIATLTTPAIALKGSLPEAKGTALDFSFTGGYLPLRSYAHHAGLELEKLTAQLSAEQGIPPEELAQGFTQVLVGNRPTLDSGGEYVLFLTCQKKEGQPERWTLLESDYSVLTVRDGLITDYAGTTYGTPAKPLLS